MQVNQLLEKAVQHLYGRGIIKKDKDIADRTAFKFSEP